MQIKFNYHKHFQQFGPSCIKFLYSCSYSINAPHVHFTLRYVYFLRYSPVLVCSTSQSFRSSKESKGKNISVPILATFAVIFLL
jgi:hypothetical protein